MSTLKILILYTRNQGYLSGFFQDLSELLYADGYDVTNFSFKKHKHSNLKNGVKILIQEGGGYFKRYIRTYQLLKNVRPDVTISNFSYVNPALLWGKALGVSKNIVWFHSLDQQMNPTRLQVLIKRMFLKLSDKIIANSYLTRNELIQIYKVPAAKIEAVPFWTNIKPNVEYHISIKNTDNFKMGCPGRFTDHKNQLGLINALSRLKNQGVSKFQLFLAGRGENEAMLKQTVIDKNLNEEIKFIGHLNAEQMLDFYMDMDLIILPSLHEAFGLVFIEAISLGKPVLVSKTFGALNFINSKSYNLQDFTFNPKNPETLNSLILKYMQGDGRQGSFFSNMYKDNFDKDLIYNQLKGIIDTNN